MHIVATLVWAALGQSVFAARPYPPLAASKRSDVLNRSAQPAIQQDGMTCEETYGPGSMACGKPELKLCFNPSKGESCCGMDGGFCQAGFQCAPVSKFCCKNGEDIATCAINAGFEVPAVESPPDNGTASASASDSDPASSTVLGSVAGNASTTRTLFFGNSTALSLPVVVAPATEDCATTVTVFTPPIVPGQPTPIPLAVGTAVDTGADAATAAPVPVPASAATTAQSSSPEPSNDSGDDSDDNDYWQYNTDQETNEVEPLTAAVPTVVAAATPNTNYTLPVSTSGPLASVSPIIQAAGAGRSVVQPPASSVWSYVVGAAAMMVFMAL